MKKLSLILVLGFVAILLNSCAADRNVDGFTNKAIDTAKKGGIVNEEEWTVYASSPYTLNNGASSTNMNYQAFDTNYGAEVVSVSVWVKNDMTQSVFYVFSQKTDGNYSEVMMLSQSVNASGTALQATYQDALGLASLNAMVTPSALMNVNINMTGTTSGQFITNGVFTKVIKQD